METQRIGLLVRSVGATGVLHHAAPIFDVLK
jgi:hypothetical protein